jgi:hypothetical protein
MGKEPDVARHPCISTVVDYGFVQYHVIRDGSLLLWGKRVGVVKG